MRNINYRRAKDEYALMRKRLAAIEPAIPEVIEVLKLSCSRYDESGVVMKEADACLIAAAPDMLEALERAKQFIENGIELGYIQQPEKDSAESQVIGIIADAIRKAKGEANGKCVTKAAEKKE